MRKISSKLGIKGRRTGSAGGASQTADPQVASSGAGKAEKHHNVTKKSLVRDLGIAVVIAFAVSAFISPTIVHETSMQPTIDPRDYIIMNKQSYKWGKVKRGDIIIFKSNLKSDDNKHTKLLIKRVIGVPGDVITIDHGKVYLNGKELEESYTAEETTDGDIHNLVVGKDEYFVMGDHRSVSKDSRDLGCIKKKSIRGKAVFRLLPFNKFGAV